MYHKVTIVGYLGRDPEMRYTPAGQPVTNFSVATSRKWTSPDGQQHDETIWWRATVWGKQAETANQYLAKGRLVLIEGQMRPDEKGNPRTFTRNDGTVGTSYDVTALNIRFLGGRGEAPPAEVPGVAEEPPAEEGEEIPF